MDSPWLTNSRCGTISARGNWVWQWYSVRGNQLFGYE